MLETLRNALKVKEIRKRLLYTFMMLVVVRLGSQIPLPFVNGDTVKSITSQFSEGAFSFFAAITGGSMENMSIFALSITPYITASIIIQLLTIAIPKLEEMQKDGEEGRKKLAEITRYVTVALALIESTAMTIGFANQGLFNTDTITISNMSTFRHVGVIVMGVVAMTAGSAALMWIGEQITESGVGNGISIVLVINIVSRMPSDIAGLFTNYVTGASSIGGKILAIIIIIAVVVGIIAYVVWLQDGVRHIGVQMSQKVQGRRQVGGQQSTIPLKVNTAGVIPIIFASSIMQFPVIIVQLFTSNSYEWTKYLSQSYWCRVQMPKYSIGLLLYIILVVVFAYFYTSITFNPVQIADNLKKAGGVVPGITPGRSTSEYLNKILNYIVFIGAVGLMIVALIPIMCTGFFNASVSFGGTSIIIIVGVVLETMKQIESMMVNRNYRGFLSE